jgi:hypothetical protein
VTPDNFLHNLSDFKDLILVVSREKGILPQLVEKDYWIMHCLYGLKRLNFDFELKGGTSLSKGYGIIHRFSEDIDLRIEPPEGMGVRTNPKHTKASHIETRRKFYDWLANTKIVIPGLSEVERDHEFDDQHLRGAGIRLFYKSYFGPLPGLKPGILLEVGFDDTTPNQEVDISSWAAEKGLEIEESITDNRAIAIKCYNPAFTFVEKLQTVSTKYRIQQEGGNFPTNFLRHYYDIYCLLDNPEVADFIKSDDYQTRKEHRFRRDDNLCIAENEAFLLSSPETKDLYRSEYEKTVDLYYDEMVPFDTILQRIKDNIDIL